MANWASRDCYYEYYDYRHSCCGYQLFFLLLLTLPVMIATVTVTAAVTVAVAVYVTGNGS